MSIATSPTPWSVDREPWMDYYLIKDANGAVIGQIFAYTGKRKKESFKQEPDLDLAHQNAQAICNAVNSLIQNDEQL